MLRTVHDLELSHLHSDLCDQINVIRRVTADIQRSIAESRTTLRDSRESLRRADRELNDADPSSARAGARWRA